MWEARISEEADRAGKSVSGYLMVPAQKGYRRIGIMLRILVQCARLQVFFFFLFGFFFTFLICGFFICSSL